MRKYIIIILASAVFVSAAWFLSRHHSLRKDSSHNVLRPQMKRILDTGEQFVLLSLFPNRSEESTPPPSMAWTETFHDYPVLGKTEVRDKVQRAALLQAFYKGVAHSDGTVAACFIPRHGIHATLGDESVDLVICFECLQVYAYNASPNEMFPITDSARPIFDRVVKAAGLTSVKSEN